MVSRSAPSPSIAKVTNMMLRVRRTTPAIEKEPSASCMSRRSCRLIRRPSARNMRADVDMIPRPPIWMRSMMTIWPKGEKYVAVSTTIRPVTQTADVAVKKASTRERSLPGWTAMGSESRIVPNRISAAKPETSTWAGVRAMRGRPGLLVYISPLPATRRPAGG